MREFFNNPICYWTEIIIGSCIIYFGLEVISKIPDRQVKDETAIEMNIGAGPKPETFIEHNGVRYFSKIDGIGLEEKLLDK